MLIALSSTALLGLYAYNLSFKPQVSSLQSKDLEQVGIIYRSNGIQSMTRYVESELTREIKKALAENPRTSTLNLSVNIVGSRVTLSGKAESKDQIFNAIKTTLETPGVKDVVSTVVIDPDIQIAGKGSLL